MHLSNLRKCSVSKEHSANAVGNNVHFCQNKCSNALNKYYHLFLLRKLGSVKKISVQLNWNVLKTKLCKMYDLFLC